MSEKSRDEKLAAGKKKLKKFQENSSKLKKDKDSPSNFNIKKISHNSEFSSFPAKIENNDKEIQKYSENLVSVISSFPLEEPTATTETIKQISRHLNGIISCSNSSLDRESQQEYLSTICELEKRNVELANLNSNKVEQIELFNSKIGCLNATIDRITKEFENEKICLENSFKKQVESYKTQLQSQIHTISLLIAEKSELQSQLSHNQKLANQRFQEIEDFTNKLKASRQKVGDLEKSVSELKHVNDKYEEAMCDILRQLEQTRNEIKKVKTEKDDLLSESSQLKSKLISKTQEISDLELTVDDLKSELEIAQVQIQHLTNNQEGHYDNLCSKLKITEQKNIDLKGNIESLKSNLQQSELQNIRLQSQYRCYIEEMEEKSKSYQSQLFEAIEAKKDISLQMEDIKNQPIENLSSYENIIHDLENVKLCLTKKTEILENNNVNLKERNECLLNKNEKLIKNVEELEVKNEGLIEKTKQLELNRIDFNQLLNQVQSDKIALSRALTQNKQLKSQLIELQEAFVKLSSENMDYSTQLQHERYVSKELATRLGEQEDELTDVRKMLSAKDEEVSKSNHSIHRLTEELLTFSSSLENYSLKRSESHFNMANKVVIENLQNDLLNSQERINQLTTENNNLQYELNQNFERFMITKSEVSCDNIDNLMLNLRQLKAERDQLLTKCEILGSKENEIPSEKDVLTVSKTEYQALKGFNDKICEELENISVKNSRLIKDNQHLEHIIEQLEGETDTIGEYIYLYQHQRSLLKQKCHSRDQLMSKLIHHKQLIDHKLLIVENLFKSLMQPVMKEDKDDIGINSTTSIYDRILKIIHELRNSSNMLSELQTSSFINSENNISDFFNNSMLSDDLLHYRIIHCKCCIGKIIDL